MFAVMRLFLFFCVALVLATVPASAVARTDEASISPLNNQDIIVMIENKLEAEAIKAARGSVVKEKLAQETALAVGNTGAEFDAFIKSEQARWKPVIARAEIKPEGT